MTIEERKFRRMIDFEECWGANHLVLCDEIVRMLLVMDDLHEAIAILDLAKARLNLRVASDDAVIRRLQEEFFNPSIEFVPPHTNPEKE
jgi:hypothetical protein